MRFGMAIKMRQFLDKNSLILFSFTYRSQFLTSKHLDFISSCDLFPICINSVGCLRCKAITKHLDYIRLNPSYATYLDDTQQILSISLGAIPEEIHFIEAYTEDKQRPFIDQLKSIQLSYQAEGMEEMRTLLEMCRR